MNNTVKTTKYGQLVLHKAMPIKTDGTAIEGIEPRYFIRDDNTGKFVYVSTTLEEVVTVKESLEAKRKNTSDRE